MEGTVTNVTNFGAFVDIGVHQDGLVHISAMSEKFIEDPRTVVKAGDIVKVKVMEVDVARKRIGLSMRMGDQPGEDNRPAKRQDRGSGRDGARGDGRPNGQGKGRGGDRRADGKNRSQNRNQSGRNQQGGGQNTLMAAKLREAFNKR